MALKWPTIVEEVSKATKHFFEEVFAAVEEGVGTAVAAAGTALTHSENEATRAKGAEKALEEALTALTGNAQTAAQVTAAIVAAAPLTSKVFDLGSKTAPFTIDLKESRRVFTVKATGSAPTLTGFTNAPTSVGKQYIQIEVTGDKALGFGESIAVPGTGPVLDLSSTSSVNRYVLSTLDNWATVELELGEPLPEDVVRLTDRSANGLVYFNHSSGTYERIAISEAGKSTAEITELIEAVEKATTILGAGPMTVEHVPIGAGNMLESTGVETADWVDTKSRILTFAIGALKWLPTQTTTANVNIGLDNILPVAVANAKATMPSASFNEGSRFAIVRLESGSVKLTGKWTPGDSTKETTIELTVAGTYFFTIVADGVGIWKRLGFMSL